MKNVPVYFYYLNVTYSRSPSNLNEYTFNDFLSEFNTFLNDLIAKNLVDIKYDFHRDEKIIWIDSFNDLGNGSYDIIFKTAKYNHRRDVIDTASMTSRGVIKGLNDGDEEKTHICIRYVNGQNKFICIHENNYYGVGIGKIIQYLNTMLHAYRDEYNKEVVWVLSSEIMPADNFLTELRRLNKISLLTLTVDKNSVGDEFVALSGRDDIRETVDISIRKIKRNINIPHNLVADYYNSMQDNSVVKRIVVDGKNESGPFRLDTELIKKKQCLNVETTALNEVSSEHFFAQAQIAIDSMR